MVMAKVKETYRKDYVKVCACIDMPKELYEWLMKGVKERAFINLEDAIVGVLYDAYEEYERLKNSAMVVECDSKNNRVCVHECRTL